MFVHLAPQLCWGGGMLAALHNLYNYWAVTSCMLTFMMPPALVYSLAQLEDLLDSPDDLPVDGRRRRHDALVARPESSRR